MAKTAQLSVRSIVQQSSSLRRFRLVQILIVGFIQQRGCKTMTKTNDDFNEYTRIMQQYIHPLELIPIEMH